MKAVVKHWPRPAATITAEYRGRSQAPNVDQALRVTPQGYNDLAGLAGLVFFPNMRPPCESPIDLAFETGTRQEGLENLGNWTTSQGKSLTPLDVRTAALVVRNMVYAVISVDR